MGKDKTSFYRVVGKGLEGVQGIATRDTKDAAGIAAVIATL